MAEAEAYKMIPKTIRVGTVTYDMSKLIRCKDCEYWQDNNGGYPHPDCRWGHDETPDEDDYCSFASDRRKIVSN